MFVKENGERKGLKETMWLSLEEVFDDGIQKFRM